MTQDHYLKHRLDTLENKLDHVIEGMVKMTNVIVNIDESLEKMEEKKDE